MNTPRIRYSEKSVLIIEDFAEFARSLKGMVHTIGCQKVRTVHNGEDAIQACKEQKFDIILSDYNLGDSKDGQQILEELIHFNLIKTNTVFIMITAENTTAMVMGALEFQPDSYLTKPFNGSLLNSRLDRAVSKKDALAPAERLMRKKQWQQALETCEKTANDFPKYRMACLRQKFECLRGLQRYDRALELATQIVNERPIPWAMMGVGEIFVAKNQVERAIDLFSDMIKEFPMVLEGYDWLAKLLYRKGQVLDAQRVLEKAVERSPKALKRQKLLGKVAEENDDIETMANAFRQAVKFGNNSAFASPDEFIQLTKSIGMQLQGVSDKDRTKLVEEAESVFDKLDTKFKRDPTVQFRSAVAHASFGSITNDEKTVEKYLNNANRIYDRIEEHLGSKESIEISESLKNLGQNELAESILEEAFEQYFDDPQFIAKASQLTTNKHLIENSKKAEKLNNEAISYFKKNDFNSAIDFFAQASEIAPNNVNINLNFVQSLLKRSQIGTNAAKDLEQAEEILSGVTRLSPQDSRFARYSELNRLTQLMLQSL